MAEASARLQIQSVAKEIFSELNETIFPNHPYVQCSIAAAKINMQGGIRHLR